MRKPHQFSDYFLILFIHVSAKDTARRETEETDSNCKVQRVRVRQQGSHLELFLFFQL